MEDCIKQRPCYKRIVKQLSFGDLCRLSICCKSLREFLLNTNNDFWRSWIKSNNEDPTKTLERRGWRILFSRLFFKWISMVEGSTKNVFVAAFCSTRHLRTTMSYQKILGALRAFFGYTSLRQDWIVGGLLQNNYFCENMRASAASVFWALFEDGTISLTTFFVCCISETNWGFLEHMLLLLFRNKVAGVEESFRKALELLSKRQNMFTEKAIQVWNLSLAYWAGRKRMLSAADLFS